MRLMSRASTQTCPGAPVQHFPQAVQRKRSPSFAYQGGSAGRSRGTADDGTGGRRSPVPPLDVELAQRDALPAVESGLREGVADPVEADEVRGDEEPRAPRAAQGRRPAH